MTAHSAADAGPDPVRLLWFWPERARLGTLLADGHVWRNYQVAAADAGMELDVVSVDDIDVLARPDGPVVYLRGEPLDRRRTVVHGKLYTWPMFSADVWRSLATFQAVREAGYCSLLRPDLNLVSNDKAATLMRLRGIDPGWLPTLSLPTRELERLRVPLAEAGITYPVVVKPASWGSGKGVVVARSEGELMTALRLAGAAELTMVVQPLVGTLAEGEAAPAGLEDVRIYCVDGVPVGALRRTPDGSSVVANVTAGGRGELIGVPADLGRRAAVIAASLDTPWLGVDFLGDGTDYWLSEVEIDACIGPVTAQLPGMDAVLARRFAAYRARFDTWLVAQDSPAPVPAQGVATAATSALVPAGTGA